MAVFVGSAAEVAVTATQRLGVGFTAGALYSPVTEIVPFETFYEAEGYHQDYFNNNPNQPYCVYVVDPKVRKFRKSFQDKLKETV